MPRLVDLHARDVTASGTTGSNHSLAFGRTNRTATQSGSIIWSPPERRAVLVVHPPAPADHPGADVQIRTRQPDGTPDVTRQPTGRGTTATGIHTRSGGRGLPTTAATPTGSTRAASRPHPGVEWWVRPRQPWTPLPFLNGRPAAPGRHRRTADVEATPAARPAATPRLLVCPA
ncbi:MAG: hypothetical protein ACR2GH_21600 [Pseudonocardia sp.]